MSLTRRLRRLPSANIDPFSTPAFCLPSARRTSPSCCSSRRLTTGSRPSHTLSYLKKVTNLGRQNAANLLRQQGEPSTYQDWPQEWLYRWLDCWLEKRVSGGGIRGEGHNHTDNPHKQEIYPCGFRVAEWEVDDATKFRMRLAWLLLESP